MLIEGEARLWPNAARLRVMGEARAGKARKSRLFYGLLALSQFQQAK